MNELCYVLGLGNSLSTFKPTGFFSTIGVNDIWKYYPADFVVCVDKPHRFDKERIKTILLGSQKEFITPYSDWSGIVLNTTVFKLSAHGRGNLKDIDNKEVLCYATSSTFSAICVAYHKGFKNIVLYGVDFLQHHSLKGKVADNEINNIIKFKEVLKKRGVMLYIGNENTALYGKLPLFKSK